MNNDIIDIDNQYTINEEEEAIRELRVKEISIRLKVLNDKFEKIMNRKKKEFEFIEKEEMEL